MNADAEFDALVSRDAGVALDRAVLHFDGAAHRVDYAAKLDENAVAGALNDAPMMGGGAGIDQIASQPPEPRQSSILLAPVEPALPAHVPDHALRHFPVL